MLNIGHNPTTDFSGFFIEVYFFDLDLDLYRQTLKIEFIDFLRDEQKFESIDALKSQLQKDKKACLKKIKELSLSS
jgi:riboflavin kinase/FMN adenylyltransferase